MLFDDVRMEMWTAMNRRCWVGTSGWDVPGAGMHACCWGKAFLQSLYDRLTASSVRGRPPPPPSLRLGGGTVYDL